MKKNKAFSMVDAMLAFLIISVAIAASMPVITKMSQVKTKLDKHVINCINRGSFSFYDDTTGETSVPSAGTACYAAYKSAKFARGEAFKSIMWKAGSGSEEEQLAAKKILRAACDGGGSSACDYFVNRCLTEGQTSGNFCDEDGYMDLTYYLKHLSTSEEWSHNYIKEKVKKILPTLAETVLGDLKKACAEKPSSIACELDKPWIYIKGCNLGNADACIEAFNNNYNKSCTQVYNSWPEAISDVYKLTFKGAANPVNIHCVFISGVSAAVTGCNAITDGADNCTGSSLSTDACSNDCLAGYNNNYNRSCNQIKKEWGEVPYGIYNLTENGPPPAALVQKDCKAPDPQCTDKPGLMCPDGTIYAGDYNGAIFTTPADQGSFSWNNGGNDYNILYPKATYPNDYHSGEYNSYILNHWNSLGNDEYLWGELKGVPYQAAAACKQLNTTNYLNHDDWYLPSFNEFKDTLNANYEDIGGFDSGSYYWTSVFKDNNEALVYKTSGYSGTIGMDRSYALKVRCIRKNGDFTPPTLPDDIRPGPVDCSSATPEIGTLCTDGTIYAGKYGSKRLYTTADFGLGKMSFNNGSSTEPTDIYTYYPYNDYFKNAENGEKNTQVLANLSDGEYYWGTVNHTPLHAAKACYDLVKHGYDDWYLPAKNELKFLADNTEALGYFYSEYYWSSTRASEGATYHIRIDDSYISHGLTYRDYDVKCIRDEDNDDSYPDFLPPAKPNVDCQDAIDDPIGSPCLDGTVYAAKSGSTKYFFAQRLYDAKTSWNNGASDWYETGINSETDGLTNTNDLLLAADVGSPYLAAQVCKDLNDLNYLGYSDWYLPAKDEMDLLLDNRDDTGWWYGDYWTSNEKSSKYAYKYYSSDTSAYTRLKSEENKVRCIRKKL